jgi:branched-chain amino acid transport system substrate-binding protein
MKQKEKEGNHGKGGALVTRRDFVKTSLVGATALMIGSPLMPSKAKAEKPIKLGLFGVCSGAMAFAGEHCLKGAQLWAEELNSKGGLLGRQIEVTQRDTSNKPEEAVRFAREFAASGDIDFIFAHGSSAEAFAIASASKEVKRIMFASAEAVDLTADPKVRSPYCFRIAYNSLYTGMVQGKFAAKVSKELGLTKWYTIAGDYAFGRDSVNYFVEFLKKDNPKVEIVGQAWPKLGEPDFTPQITAILGAKPQAVYSAHFGGDVITFIKQGMMYGLFEKSKFVMKDVISYDTINALVQAIGKFPAGLYAGTQYLKGIPDTKANQDFNNAFMKRFSINPIVYAAEIYSGLLLLEEAVKKAKSTENEAVIRAMNDLSVKAPIGTGSNSMVTMRGRDHQLINYAVGCGTTISEAPYLKNIVYASWDEIMKDESVWMKNKGYL